MSFQASILLTFLIPLAPLFSGTSGCLLAQAATVGPGETSGAVQDPRLKEISGVVASRRQNDLLWVHNDSGNSADLYALTREGKTLATCRVRGAQARDWEDIALGPGPDLEKQYLYIGDIGDNRARYPTIRIYRIPEPEIDTTSINTQMDTQPCETIQLVYPDGPHDAETLLIDPRSGDLYVISKRNLFSRVYRAPAPLDTEKEVLLTLVTLLPWGLATGGEISPDGNQILIRGPSHAMIWQRPVEGPLWLGLRSPGQEIHLLPEPQGEAICFSGDQRSIFTISEGSLPPIHYYPLGEPALSPPTEESQ